MDDITYEQFAAVEMRIGKVLRAEAFPEARMPAYKLEIDFGPEVGTRTSSAQITEHYSPQDLVGRLVVCAVNIGPRMIGPFRSECLTMGSADNEGEVLLLDPGAQAVLGARIY